MIRVLRYVVAGIALLALACGGGSGGGGSASASLTAPVITLFTTGSPTINAGASTILTWQVQEATTITIDQGVGTVSGTSVPVNPSATTTYTLMAANAAGSVTASVTVTVTAIPPSGLAYTSNPAIYTKDVPISANSPGNSGGAIASFGVNPPLPPGLVLDPGTGNISGIPAAITPGAVYTITGTNSGGSTSALMTITINDSAPAFVYGNGGFSFTTGTAITTLTAAHTGGAAVIWSISPALPSGLIFNTSDGSIGGTPTAIAASAGYTVTATNSGGSCSVTPILTVNPPAPSISVQPADVTLEMGGTAGFTVAANGTGALSYQWLKNGSPIGGAIGAGYTTPVTVLGDDGAQLSVRVDDAYGNTITSIAATLTVLPDLATWLGSHANVAAAIRWQFRQANMANSYQAPTDTDKVAWTNWSQGQKDDLNQAYQDAKTWFAQGTQQVAMDPTGLTDQPVNQHPQTSNNALSVMEWVTPAYMWKLYIAHLAFALAQEIAHPLPWSLTTYSDESLRYLFDSSVMAWYLPSGNFGLGTYGGANFPALRANNRPQTSFAPPMWTYPWLQQAGLIGSTRRETIGKVMDWMRANMGHFIGAADFGTYNAVWQYRGWVPLSKIVNGTIDANNPSLGLQHWTAGCHGSVGFLHEVLRVLNIPVQPVWIGGHELAYFTTERLYLDHGDDPYNANVRIASTVPILNLLIDEAAYQSLFTNDLTVNVTDAFGQAAANVGYMARNFR